MSRKKRTKPGPKGPHGPKLPVVLATLTCCPKCGSTKRERYTHVKTMAIGDSTITWRHTRCSDCGQHRRDKTIENCAVRNSELPVSQPA